MKNRPVLVCLAALVIVAGMTGCSKSSDTQTSTAAEHDAFKGRKPTPEEFAQAMARAQSHRPAPPAAPK